MPFALTTSPSMAFLFAVSAEVALAISSVIDLVIALSADFLSLTSVVNAETSALLERSILANLSVYSFLITLNAAAIACSSASNSDFKTKLEVSTLDV